jgi:hypothetical protein
MLDLPESMILEAEDQAGWNYIQKTRHDAKGKARELCYPKFGSSLHRVQGSIKDRVLTHLPLSPCVLGYRKRSNNIDAAGRIAGQGYTSKLDVKSFHPSISASMARSYPKTS